MDDSKIIELFFARDETAIEELDRKYSRHASTLARSILRSGQDAEECVNDARLRVWNSIPPCRPDNLRAYLSRIVRNLCLDRLRMMDAAKRPDVYGELREELTQLFDADVEDKAEEHRLTEAINSFLRGLASEERILFVGRYWHMQSVKELGALCSMSGSNVKTKLYRLRQRLKEYLKEEGFDV